MEQMDLEVREIPIQSRAMYNSRLKSYKQEVEKLEKDFVSTLTPYCSSILINDWILLIFCNLSAPVPHFTSVVNLS